MKILLTGKDGQVGHELQRSLRGAGELVACDRAGMDLSDASRIRDVIRTVKPDLIVNPAAYTAVDRAETDIEAAYAINAQAPAVIAEEARKIGAVLIHYSTDYVFDGAKPTPYTEDDAPHPLNVYGQTKLEGERAIQAAGGCHLILRATWVYGMRRSNFLMTMLRLAHERDELRVVDDQCGAPTWSRTIAEATAGMVRKLGSPSANREAWEGHAGLYHLAAQGQTTWHGFAQAIFKHASISSKPRVIPIKSAAYPSPARRPANSVLSCSRFVSAFGDLPDWRQALSDCLAEGSAGSVD